MYESASCGRGEKVKMRSITLTGSARMFLLVTHDFDAVCYELCSIVGPVEWAAAFSELLHKKTEIQGVASIRRRLICSPFVQDFAVQNLLGFVCYQLGQS